MITEQNVRLAVNTIADDLLALCHLVLEDDNVSTNLKVGKNTLANSELNAALFAVVGSTYGDNPVITALFNNYVGYIEWDRPPMYGKPPPISALKDWAEKNGIPSDAGTLYAISYAIWRDGHAGRPIFATIDLEVDKLLDTDWSESLYESLTENLDNFFNS